MVQENTDKVALIKERLKAARDRKKSYADNRRKPLEFGVGDQMLLKVSPWKGAIRFGKKGKLAPRYVRPFEILERIGPIAYRLRLPQELSNIHDTFHVSNLKKCLVDANLHVPLEEIRVEKTLRFVKEPEEIMDHKVKKLKRSRILIVIFHWNSKHGPEFTWEREDFMNARYPNLFADRVEESTPTSCRVVIRIKEVHLRHAVWLFGSESFANSLSAAVLATAANPFMPPAEYITIEKFLKLIGYEAEAPSATKFYIKHPTQPWQTLFKVLNCCTITRMTSLDQAKLNMLQMFHAVVNQQHVDYARLIWSDIIYQIKQTSHKAIQYP
ncbi:hypothetical protein Tco_0729686 [Tanacetum coccineum]|uniref:Tf2-1-like SH3-like domain-containing protein n=1 Tax=Tanacetum coccineum TaxID=301880 RepID=A0ABQ4YQI3_9ASTR